MNEKRYAIDDLILPILAEKGNLSQAGPEGAMCPIEVRVTDDYIFLRVGPRDWQWNHATGELIGSGTSLSCPPPNNAPIDTPAAP